MISPYPGEDEMKHVYLAVSLSSLAVLTAAPVLAQDAPVAEENAAAAQVAPDGSEEWVQFSSNDRNLYLIDLKNFRPAGDATSVRIGRVPVQGPSTVFAHRIDEYEIRCSRNQYRMTVEIEFDDTGTEVDRYPEAEAEWDTIGGTSLPAYFKAMVCEGSRPTNAPASSIKAFIERGRK